MAVGGWAVLGLEPTRDQREIRRAYAQRLKLTNPEDDAAGFQALHAAYQQALAFAAHQPAGVGVNVPARPAGTAAKPQAPEQVAELLKPPEPAKALAEEPPRQEEAGPKPRPTDARPVEARRRAPPVVVQLNVADEEQAHRLALQALSDLLRRPDADPKAVTAAFQAVVQSPAMDAIATYAQCEEVLISLILASAPRSDGLVDAAIAFFRWDRNLAVKTSAGRAAVLARRDDLAFLARLRRRDSYHHTAFVALTRKPVGERLWRNRLTPGLSDRVRSLLARIQSERPGAMQSLDPEALAWWRGALADSSLDVAIVYAIIPVSALAGALWLTHLLGFANLATEGVAFLLLLASLFGLWIFGVEPLQARWRSQWRAAANWPLRLGWAPAALLFLAVSALAPANVLTALAVALCSAAVAFWAIVTGALHRRPVKGALTHATSAGAASLIVTALEYVLLGVFWLIASRPLPDLRKAQMSAAMAATAVTFVAGGGPLFEAWRTRLTPYRRGAMLLLLALGAVLTSFVLWAASPGPELVPLAVLLTTTLVALQMVPHLGLQGPPYQWRHVLVWVGWIGWALLAPALETVHQGNAGLLLAGLWILGGVAGTVGAAFLCDGAALAAWRLFPARRLQPS